MYNHFINTSRLFALLCIVLLSSVATSSAFAVGAISQDQINAFQRLPKAQQRTMVMQLPDDQKVSIYKSLSSSQQQHLLSALSTSEKSLLMSKVGFLAKGTATTTQASPVAVAAPALSMVKKPSVIEKTAEAISKKASLKEGENAAITYPPLKQFGYSLFQGVPTTFAPATGALIPNEYVMGPGDEINVLLFGKENVELSLPVTREGIVNFPGIGPIVVSGLTFKEMKGLFELRVSQQKIGVKVNVTLGALRSIRIFVLGDVNRPGSYTVSALSTLTNALFVSGGIKPIGTLRDIELKRRGQVIANFDLYDLLLNGDTSSDVRLLPGDVIFVKPLGKTVGIGGEVRRPAIYELSTHENTIEAVLNYSGGILPTAFPEVSQIERINEHGQRTLIELDLSEASSLSKLTKDGDTVRIFSVLDQMNDIVMLSGHVRRPGGTQWRPGLRVQDVLKSMDELKFGADTDYGLVRREATPNGEVSVIRVNLKDAINDPFGPENILLSPRDQLTVFSNDNNRAPIIEGLLKELRNQARYSHPELVVSIKGSIRFPGAYPYEPEMRVSDLIRASLDVLPATDMEYALIKREHHNENRIEVFSFPLGDALKYKGQPTDVKLEPKDEVTIFKLSQDRSPLIARIVSKLEDQARYGQPASVVRINGNVKYPGAYPLESNMRVSDLIRASLDVLPATDMEYALIKREHHNENRIEVFSFPLGDALKYKGQPTDVKLEPKDEVTIFKLSQDRSPLIARIVSKLEDQARYGQPASVVRINGNVKYPGAYPLESNMRVSDLIRASLDVLPATDMEYAILHRESVNRDEVSLLPISLNDAMRTEADDANPILQPRDELLVLSLSEDRNDVIGQYVNKLRLQARHGQPELIVSIDGNVRHPGDYPLSSEMRISDLVLASLYLLPDTDMDYALLQRFSPSGLVSIVPISLNNALSQLGSKSDIKLLPKDKLMVFEKGENRQNAIEHILSSLKQQAKLGQPTLIVNINGTVKEKGDYPLTKGMRISDLLVAAGGLNEAAYSMTAEVTRRSIGEDGGFGTSHHTFNLGKAVAGDLSQNILLEPHDRLTIMQAPAWGNKNTIKITGQVNFPGIYPISEGETLTQALYRAGGVSDFGDAGGAFFSRASLRDRESRNKNRLIDQMNMDMALLQKDQASLVVPNPDGEAKATAALASMEQVIAQLNKADSLGRLVIDLPAITSNTSQDILLKDGDTLHVPQLIQEVSVQGEVMSPTSIIFTRSNTLDQYINLAGGLTSEADDKRIYIIKSNGAIVTTKSSSKQLFANTSSVSVEPGDVIMIPLDLDNMSDLTKWSNISQISYQFAITAASISALGIF